MTEGTLIFLLTDHSPMSEAICASQQGGDMDHVAIFTHTFPRLGPEGAVIEARPEYGVVITPLQKFLCRGSGYLTAGESLPAAIRERAVRIASQYIGLPYNQLFTRHDASARPKSLYCSELVEFSYTDDEGNPLFFPSPMNFRNAHGCYPSYWTDYFTQRKTEIPQGISGTSPEGIYIQCRDMDIK